MGCSLKSTSWNPTIVSALATASFVSTSFGSFVELLSALDLTYVARDLVTALDLFTECSHCARREVPPGPEGLLPSQPRRGARRVRNPANHGELDRHRPATSRRILPGALLLSHAACDFLCVLVSDWRMSHMLLPTKL